MNNSDIVDSTMEDINKFINPEVKKDNEKKNGHKREVSSFSLMRNSGIQIDGSNIFSQKGNISSISITSTLQNALIELQKANKLLEDQNIAFKNNLGYLNRHENK